MNGNDKTTEKLQKLISDIYVENNDENVTNISNSTSESKETSACEIVIEITNLEPPIESIPSLEVDAFMVENGHLTKREPVTEDCEPLVSGDAVTADQPLTEPAAATIPAIGQSTSILDNVGGEDNESDSDQLIKDDSTYCVQGVPNVVEELEISISEGIKTSESIGDVITCPPASEVEIDVANTHTNDDIPEVKNEVIESDQETSTSSDQNVFTRIVTIPVQRSISEATTVSRTISDDLEIKGKYHF